MTDFSPFVRIAMRYLTGYLLTSGYIADDTAGLILADADLEYVLTGLLTFAISEGWYTYAKRQGGAT